MPTSVSLRRTLRTIPTFRFLPKDELDTVVAHLTCKEYRSGTILWRAGTHLDFIGIIHKGEIIVEYRHNGSVKHSAKLSAGTFMQPRDLTDTRSLSSVSAYAATDVTLYVLHLEQLATLRSKCLTLDGISAPAPQDRLRRLLWGKLWAVTVAILIALFVWRDAASALSGVLYLVSEKSQKSTDYQKALRLLDYAVCLDPEAALAYNQAGYIWFRMDNTYLAATAFNQALNVDETSGPALNNLAITYFTTGLADHAAVLQQRAAQIDPDIAVIRYNLGLILIEQKDYVEAIRAFREASRIEPDWALPHVQMSFVHLQMADYVQAEQAAHIATRLDPTQQSAHLSLAIALYYQDKSQEALTSVDNALHITPDDVVSRFYKALILHDLGETDGALSMLRRLLESSNDPQQRSRIAAEIEFVLRSSQGSF